jgi:general secretion pathway protein A
LRHENGRASKGDRISRAGILSATWASVYLEYYGLTEPPFDITPNPRFLFYSAKHREAFNHLLYGIRERKGFVQMTGEVGAGKTTLCRSW